jgi:DNA repair protein RadC
MRAAIVQQALELLAAEVQGADALSSPGLVKDFLRLKLGERPHEVFAVVFLDSQHRVIAFDEMFRGTLSQTSVYPREIVKEALARNAAAVVLAHSVARHRMRLMCPELLCARALSAPRWAGQLRRRRGT